MNNGVQGIQGDTGNGIVSISKTGTSGLVDTYTITYTNGNTTTFTVSNGKGISSIVKTGSAGLIDTYRITYNDGTYFDYTVTNGQDGEVTEEELQDVYEQMSSELEDGTGTGTSIDTSDSAYWKAEIGLIGNTEQATSILPSEYQQVEYIESTGTQYINTGVTPDINTEIRARLKNTSSVSTIDWSGSNASEYKGGILIGKQGSKLIANFYYGNITPTGASISADTNFHDYITKNGLQQIDDTVANVTVQQFNNSLNIYIFNFLNDYGGTNEGKQAVKYFKIYKNNVLVRDFIPCYRKSDNEIGLYDLVNGVFYTNAGTGTFTKGSNISLPNPDYPQDIQVVKGSNNVKVQNKNYLDISKCVMGANNANANTTITYSTKTNRACTKFDVNPIYVKPSTTYIIKKDTYYFSVAQINSNNIVINDSGWKSANYSFTTSANCQKITMNFKKNNEANFTIEEFKTAEFQVEEGSMTTPYIEHQEQNYPITLPTGMELCKIGNNQDYIYKNIVEGNWYKHSEIGKFGMNTLANLFDNITYFQSNFNSNNGIISLRLYNNLFSNLNIKNVSFKNYYNEKLKSQEGGWNSVNSKNRFSNIDGLTIWLHYTDLGLAGWTTETIPNLANKLTTCLGDTNFYLPLRTPTDTQITDTTLINQLNDLYNKFKTYQGVSHITQTNADMPFILTLDYKKSNLLRIKALENA